MTLPIGQPPKPARSLSGTRRRTWNGALPSMHTSRTVAPSSHGCPAPRPPHFCSSSYIERSASGSLQARAVALAEPELELASGSSTSTRSVTPAWGAFPSSFEWGEVLGEGSFGRVRVATDTTTGEQYAVKIVSKNGGDRMASIAEEVSIWQRLNGAPTINSLHGVYQDSCHVYLVQELCTGGDLQTLLDSQELLSEQEAAQAAASILTAIAECHDRGICYGDVKPANFLLRVSYPSLAHVIDPSQPRGALQLHAADFGCSQQCDDEDTPCLSKVTGTPVYIAPEILRGEGYNMSSDVWSAGVLLFQMFTNQFPFWNIDTPYIRALPIEQVFDDIQHADLRLDAEHGLLPAGAADLLGRMLARDVDQRISARQALQHPWLQSVLASMQ